ncbi:MAG: hypothetical protein KC486_30350 [Myxococcales bacterium]|nr:hypothetical protein [Myxococcales bacterium]
MFAGLLACGESGQPHATTAARPETKQGPTTSPSTQAPEVRSAVRCAECHEPYVRTWEASAHADAARSPYYQALGGGKDRRCAACHTPLRGALDGDDPIHDEGITCDACHGVTAVASTPRDPGLTFDLVSNRKYGPLCDSKDHYFHRVGCSQLFTESRFCGACHHLEWPARGGGAALPVITDFAEWSASDARGSTSCQECHMSGEPGEVARGWDPRDKVSRHDLLGDGRGLLGDAVDLEARAVTEGAERWIEVEVSNRGAPHSIPAGLAGRRLVLRAEFVDAKGDALPLREERVYARVLVDKVGAEVPFTRAVAVAEDSRLGPGERRVERFRVPDGASAAKLSVERLALAPTVAAALGVDAPVAESIAGADVALTSDDR